MNSLRNITTVLIMLVLAVTVFAQPGPGAGKGFGPGDGMGPGPFMFKALDLNEEQQAEISAMQTGHMKTMESLRSDMQKLRSDLQLATVEDKYNESTVNKLIEAISAQHSKIEKERISFMRLVRAKLTDEQKNKFDQFILSHKGPKGAGHRGNGHRGGKGMGPCGGNF